MAFILKEKKERAERILEFYANAVHPGNTDKDLQNFYYLNEKRGFYQSMNIKDYHTREPSDRWMGDMCWLLLAYKFYERQYSSDKYATISNLLRDLLRSYYVQDPAGLQRSVFLVVIRYTQCTKNTYAGHCFCRGTFTDWLVVNGFQSSEKEPTMTMAANCVSMPSEVGVIITRNHDEAKQRHV